MRTLLKLVNSKGGIIVSHIETFYGGRYSDEDTRE